MEEIKKSRGGKREGAGRKPVGISTHAMALKLDNDLFEALGLASQNKNRYINDAVREKMAKDGLIWNSSNLNEDKDTKQFVFTL